MPGLPRKSTVKQFKKLMKKSGKAKTNKDAGGSDPSARKIATYEQYCLMREGHEDLDPYGEEIWDERNKVKELYDWLIERVGDFDFGYELIYAEDPLGIELLKEEDDELIEDKSNYFALFVDGLVGNLYARYYVKGNPNRAKTGQHRYQEGNVDIVNGKEGVFLILEHVIKSIKEPVKEGVKWYSKGKLIKSLEDDIIEDYDPVGIGDDFPSDPNDVRLDQVYTPRSDIGVRSNSYKVTDIDMDNFNKITFVTNAGSRFIVPFNKVKDYDFIRIS